MLPKIQDPVQIPISYRKPYVSHQLVLPPFFSPYGKKGQTKESAPRQMFEDKIIDGTRLGSQETRKRESKHSESSQNTARAGPKSNQQAKQQKS